MNKPTKPSRPRRPKRTGRDENGRLTSERIAELLKEGRALRRAVAESLESVRNIKEHDLKIRLR